ncbi:MAG TPA: TlpA family protein disulfide reductase [Phaeodactylibacter sp.]|nr:TlpA family protein disulfide reductase [Phaeodactylibacter sp.]
MKKSLLFISILFLGISCNNNDVAKKHLPTPPQNIENKISIYHSFDQLAPIFEKQNDTTYLINFWATTCPPCIREMPHFEALEKKYKTKKLRILLVSLDDKKNAASKVKRFIKKHKIKPKVILLADDNYSAWTDKVDASWYGALPATLIFKNKKRHFSMGAFESFEDLEKTILPFFSK